MNFQPEQKKNSEQKADGLHACQHRSKPLVGSRVFCQNKCSFILSNVSVFKVSA
jgi:hypothetical protein